MTDMMLPQVPQAPAPVKPAKAAPKPADDTQEVGANQGFSKVLKSQMDNEPKPTEAAEGAADTSIDRGTSPEQAGQTTADAGKPLPQTGNAGEALLAVLTGNAATDEAPAETPESAAAVTPGAAEVLPQEPVLPDAHAAPELQLPVAAATGHGQAKPDGTAATRPQLAPWTLGRKTELPAAAQTAVAQAVREESAASPASQTTPFALERFGAEVRALAGAQSRAAGNDPLGERVLGAGPPTAASAHAASQAVSNLLPTETPVSARATLPTATLETPLRQPGWDQALGERVMWVVNNKFQGVELKLNPAHLGPIEVRVQMQNDQAQVSFVAQHAPVREALEAALPRLREMFGANGFNLVDVNVSQHSFAEQQRQARTAGDAPRGGVGQDDEPDLGGISQPEFTRAGGSSRGAIDLFA